MNSEHPEQPALLKSGDLPATVRNRRGRKSLLERGSATLSHASQYLMSESSQDREIPRPIDLEALAILFEAGRKLYRMERRLPSREIMASWLQTIAYMRAGLEKPGPG
jgi:hypothetical protein